MDGVEKRGHSPQAFPNPALRKEREGRATHCVADAREVKSLGHPAASISFSTSTVRNRICRRSMETSRGIGDLEGFVTLAVYGRSSISQ